MRFVDDSPDQTPQLIEFLLGRLAERQQLADRMQRAVWPTEVYITPSDDTGPPGSGRPVGCVAVSETAPQAYARMWNPHQVDAAGRDAIEHGWVIHESAEQVWSPRIAEEMAAEVAAHRTILRAYQEADWAARTTKDAIAQAEAQGRARALRQVVRLLAARHATRRGYPPHPAATG